MSGSTVAPAVTGGPAAGGAGPGEVIDLASGNPDPRLLPPLRPALDTAEAGWAQVDNVQSVLPGLGEVARARFARGGIGTPDVAAFTGALDAMERVLLTHVAPGDRVAVEDPGYPPVLYLVAALQLKAVPVPVDSAGLRPDRLDAIVAGVRALIVTPRAQNPTGAFTTPARASALRDILRAHPDVLVIEDDHASDVAGPGLTSLAAGGGQARWAVIQSVSKSLGADLRLALMAADQATMVMARGRQRRGPGWVSGLLQQVVLHQWTSPTAAAALEAARAEYAQRRAALVSALAERGVNSTGQSGLNVWVPVADEESVLAHVRDAGFALAAGRRFRRAAPPAVRVTIASLPAGRAAAVAAAITTALAAQPGRGGRETQDRKEGSRR